MAKGGKKEPLKAEKKTINFAFASVVSINNITKGDKLSKSNIWVKRPASGYFSANDYSKLLGKKAKRNIKKDEQLKRKDIF